MPFTIEPTAIQDVKIVVPTTFPDDRGFFMEVYRQDLFAELGLTDRFVQLNQSRSARNVVRGLHFQWDPPVGKLMRVIVGRAFLVAVDIRVGSPTLGRWVGLEVSAEEPRHLWAPASFARGFCVLSDFAEIEYLTTGTYNKATESGIRWNDPAIGIEWPVSEPILSAKDAAAQSLAEWLAGPDAANFQFGSGPAGGAGR
ncbi:MAG: dTDP-4-dehydrorhamnose 3,5-epimerase [Candidatus Limnocylindrales bacterium]|jgi:dTDP-4-dehydrorhamnose 3,5-epimerase